LVRGGQEGAGEVETRGPTSQRPPRWDVGWDVGWDAIEKPNLALRPNCPNCPI